MNSVSTKNSGSRFRRIARGYGHLVLAFIIGTLLSGAVLWMRVPGYSQVTYVLYASPADDQSLIAWGQAQPGVESFEAKRQEKKLLLRWQYRGVRPRPSQSEVAQGMRGLGYEIAGIQETSMGLAGGLTGLLTDPLHLAAILAGTQLAFLVIGGYQWRRLAELPTARPAWSARDLARWTVIGLAGGLVLLAFNFLYGFLMEQWLGASAPSPWSQASLMSPAGKTVFLVFGAWGAPLAEEVFFRGYLLGMFRQANDTRFGIGFSSVLFGLLHATDPYHLPATMLFGFILAGITCRTNSLWPAIVAHSVNNSVAILMLTSSAT